MPHSCFIKSLESNEAALQSARTAIEINPVNASNSIGVVNVPEAQRIAVMTSKYWGAGGVSLTVGFMESIPEVLAAKIVSYMNRWSVRANVKFVRTRTDPQIRISRGAGGYWSYLGTDVLHAPRAEQTMNLEGFTVQTPDSEFERVITHETGHTLGCPHEHPRKEIVALLDVNKTIAHFSRTQGWTRQEVMEQVLTPLDERSIMSTPADQDSVMCYQIPGSCTKNGQPIRGGAKINESDFAFMAKIYPLSSIPPTDPLKPGKKRIIIEVDGEYEIIKDA